MKTKIVENNLLAFLSLLFLFQSCSIYQSGNINLEQAVDTNGKVKISNTDGEKLIFKRIEKNDDQFFGLAKLNSKASKKMQKLGIDGRQKGTFYAFGLETLGIQKLQAKNYTGSTLATIGVSVVGVFAIFLALFAIIDPLGDL